MRGHSWTGFCVVGVAFLVTSALATVPSPLYRLYQGAGDYGQLVATVVFAAYAVGVLAALVLAGHLSDVLGRRPMMLCAVGFGVASAATFLVSAELPVLLTGRVLCGVAIGLVMSTGTAFLADLHERARPGVRSRLPEVTATAANMGGLALGSGISGLVAARASQPLVTPYLVFLVALVLMLPAVALVPETRAADVRPRYRLQRFALPRSSRTVFWAAAGAGGIAFSCTGLYASQGATMAAELLGTGREDVGGALPLVSFGCAAFAQALLSAGTPRHQTLLGLVPLVVGTGTAAAGIAGGTVVALFAGAAVAGTGAGITVKGAIAVALAVAEPARRGETLAGTFLVAYLGLCVPVLAYGALADAAGQVVAAASFAVGVLLCALLVGTVLLGAGRAPAEDA